MVRWQKQVFIHTRLSHAYLALARLSCPVLFCSSVSVKWRPSQMTLIVSVAGPLNPLNSNA